MEDHILNTITGNLVVFALDKEFDVIVHECNCFQAMSKGISKDIKKLFPLAGKVDKQTIRGDASKLGTYSMAKYEDLVVVNAYIEYRYGNSSQTSKDMKYDSLRTVFGKIAQDFPDCRIGIPRIGAGWGNWSKIQNIIYEAFDGNTDNVTVVIPP